MKRNKIFYKNDNKKLWLILLLLLILLMPLIIFLSQSEDKVSYRSRAAAQPTSAPTRRKSQLTLKVYPVIVPLGGQVTMDATVKNETGAAIKGKVVFAYDNGWSYGEYKTTNDTGFATYTLPIKREEWRSGFYGRNGSQKVPSRYQVIAYFQGSPEYKGCMARANIEVIDSGQAPSGSITINQCSSSDYKKPPGLIYWGWDYTNFDPNNAPEDLLRPACKPGDTYDVGGNIKTCQNDDSVITKYGPFGSIYYQTWNRLDMTALQNYIDKASEMKVTLPDGQEISKPVIHGFYFYDVNGDLTPNSVRDRIGGSYELKPDGCELRKSPKYCDSVWQEEFKKSVTELGRNFDGKVAAELISFGYDGEAVDQKNNIGSCDYEKEGHKLCSENEFQQLLGKVMKWYRDAFPNTTLYLQGKPSAPDNTYGIGYKTNGWVPELSAWTYSNIAHGDGESRVWNLYPSLPRAFESRYGSFFTGGARDYNDGIFAGTYRMLLDMMAHKPDFIDLHSDHWLAFLRLPSTFNFDLSTFVNAQMGKSVETTPFVWTVPRELQKSVKKEEWSGQLSYLYGDYNFYLYRRENIPGNKTFPVRENELPETAKKQPFSNPADSNTHADMTNRPETPSSSARRTDQASGNKFMSFDIDNGWQYAGIDTTDAQYRDVEYKISLIYLDKGSDKFSVEYKDQSGALKKDTVTKTNSNTWKKYEKIVKDAYFNDTLDGMTDIRINSEDGGDETIHMLQIWGKGPGATFPEQPVSHFPDQIDNDIPDAPTGTPTPTPRPIDWFGILNAPGLID